MGLAGGRRGAGGVDRSAAGCSGASLRCIAAKSRCWKILVSAQALFSDDGSSLQARVISTWRLAPIAASMGKATYSGGQSLACAASSM